MSKKTFKQFLIEAPLGDYKTIGNWDKGSSFRSKRDRMIIQHPRTVETLKKKLKSRYHTFNLFFVNSKEANEHTEVGRVDLEWVRKNLGEEVAKTVEPTYQEEGHVNIIYTNNKGEEGRPMTTWMMFHRMAHSMARPNAGRGKQFPSYQEAMDTVIWHLAQILEEYGIKDFASSEDKLNSRNAEYSSNGYPLSRFNARTRQQIMKKFFTEVCTFRSARENNLRDWFEVTNELFAQYATTGKVKFKAPPKKFGSKMAFGRGTGEFFLRGEEENVSDTLNSLANTLKYYFDDMLSDAESSILVM